MICICVILLTGWCRTRMRPALLVSKVFLYTTMVVSFITTQCVNQCHLDCIRDGSTILKLRDSQLAKTNLAPLRIWFCHTFNKVDQVGSNVTTGRQKKIDCFSVGGICYHCNTVFEAMVSFYH